MDGLTPAGYPHYDSNRKMMLPFINVYDLDVTMDGVNEVGLSVGFIWLPGTKYQKVGADEENRAINIMDFGSWVLGNFATVEEVKNAVSQVRVWGSDQLK